MAFENLTVEQLDAMDVEEFNSLVENYDQLDELSKGTLRRYALKSTENAAYHDAVSDAQKKGILPNNKGDGKYHGDKAKKRYKGVSTAIKKLTKEDLDEMSPEEFDAVLENFEQLDELSKKTLGSYVRKAGRDAAMHAASSVHYFSHGRKAEKKGDKESSEKHDARANKHFDKEHQRYKGIDMATKKLTKEDVDLDEGLELEEGRSRLSPEDAHRILTKHDAHKDYFTLSHSTASAIADEGTKHGYRKSRNAPGSYGRMFHQHLSRLAAKHKTNESLTLDALEAMSEEELTAVLENYDQLDELSKDTLKSYVGKAKKGVARSKDDVSFWNRFATQTSDSKKSAFRKSMADRFKKQGEKRKAGIATATRKMKESNDSLVIAALNKDAIEFQEIFNHAMAVRVKGAIEDVTPEITQSLFKVEESKEQLYHLDHVAHKTGKVTRMTTYPMNKKDSNTMLSKQSDASKKTGKFVLTPHKG